MNRGMGSLYFRGGSRCGSRSPIPLQDDEAAFDRSAWRSMAAPRRSRRGHERHPGRRDQARSSLSFPTPAPEVRPRRSIRRGQRLHRRRVADRGRTPSLPSYAPNLHQRHERSASPRSQRGTAASAWAWSRYTCRAQVTASRPDRRGATTGDRRSTRRGRRQRALRSGVGSSIGPSFKI
jgi:hypothetical protein